MTALDFFARWRVRLGYLLAVVVLWLARPTLRTILLGAVVGSLGLWIRAYAAGFLHKQQVLTTMGPYARTRNPLYFGSSLLALGTAVAMNSLWSAALLLFYFALVYSLVMRREELELQQQHGEAFTTYASTVPLFFPKFFVASKDKADSVGFSWSQYKKNHEYQAAIGFTLLLIGLIVIWWLRLP